MTTRSKKSRQSDISSASLLAWEHLLDNDNDSEEHDIESIVSREFGPLHRPPNLLSLRKTSQKGDARSIFTRESRRTRKRASLETDESQVSSYSYSLQHMDKSSITTKIIVMGVVLGVLTSAAFATSTLLLDAFSITSADITAASQLDTQMLQPTVDRNERFESLRKALFEYTNPKDFTSGDANPQVVALDWLANRDGLKLDHSSPNLLQRYALAVLFYATSGAGWKRQLNFMSDEPECEWKAEGGVRKCVGGYVTDLSLWNNLKGTIPTELFHLSKLQVLYIARNELEGTIPTEIGKLTDLTYLGLQHNQLKGEFPSAYMGDMLKLTTVCLEKNDLTGTIRRVDPFCQLKENAVPVKNKEPLGGVLKHVTADCKTFVQWKKPEISCGCCSKCYAA